VRRLARLVLLLGRAVSLLLCVVVCVLWVRSYFVCEMPQFYGKKSYFAVASSRGIVRFDYVEQAVIEPWTDAFHLNVWRPPIELAYSPYGYGVGPPLFARYQPAGRATDMAHLTTRHWLLAFAFFTPWLPTCWRRLRRAHRRFEDGRAPTPGICRVCGYDLRATPDRCPECGTPAGG
jgi:hypothetical protein